LVPPWSPARRGGGLPEVPARDARHDAAQGSRAAVISTAWNRWATERRFQRRAGTGNRCVFNCGAGAEDTIEHYRYCKVVREAHWRHLRVRPDDSGSLLPAWILGRGGGDKLGRARAAMGTYATYRLYNAQKHGRHTRFTEKEDIVDAFGQFVREGALRHPACERALLLAWSAPG